MTERHAALQAVDAAVQGLEVEKQHLREFINEVESRHFRTAHDTGANLNALLVWNIVRERAGLDELSLADLGQRHTQITTEDKERKRPPGMTSEQYATTRQNEAAKIEPVDVDALPVAQYLMLETLAGRHRCGERMWTFPRRLARTARQLEDLELVWWKSGVIQNTILVGLTPKGRMSMLSDTYKPPNAGSDAPTM